MKFPKSSRLAAALPNELAVSQTRCVLENAADQDAGLLLMYFPVMHESTWEGSDERVHCVHPRPVSAQQLAAAHKHHQTEWNS